MGIRTENKSFSTATAFIKVKKANAVLSREGQWRLYIIALIIFDALTAMLAFRLAFYLRFESLVEYFDPTAFLALENYRFLLDVMPLVWLAIFAANGLYIKEYLLGGTREYELVFRATSQGFILIVLAGFFERSLVIARGWLLMTWILTFIVAAAERFLLRRLVYALRRNGFFMTPAVIVGANEEGRWLAEQLLRWETSGLQLIGFVDKKEPVTSPLHYGLVCLGSVDELGEIIRQHHIGEVILASSAFSTRDYLLEIFRKYGMDKDLHIRMSSGLYEILTTSLTVNEYAYVPLVHINKVRLTGADNAVKTMLDCLIAVSVLLIFSPFLLLLALLVKMSSPGPIFHKRLVMGLNGKKFHALKFRSMYINGDEILDQHPDLKQELESNYKLKADPRITPIGRFLRKFSLDELPQLINVLKREMSIVGPRMISPEEVALFKQFDMNLLTVLPGITGLWQVSGRSDISYDERVRLDMYYIRNWSLWLDLQLLFQTIPAVLRSRGAY
jgi:exopolysaccharide biosynthesis polyprenyl glycosylphosphotransferase